MSFLRAVMTSLRDVHALGAVRPYALRDVPFCSVGALLCLRISGLLDWCCSRLVLFPYCCARCAVLLCWCSVPVR